MHLLVAVLLLADPLVAEPNQPLWLLERTHGSWITARTFGSAKHKAYDANTTLAITCSDGRAVLRLDVDVKSLGFDSDPYEGPDATKSGPLLLTTPDGTAVSHGVSGYWGVPGMYQVGGPFVFETAVPPVELKRWLANDLRGKTVRGQLDELTFTFVWPRNVDALRAACKAR